MAGTLEILRIKAPHVISVSGKTLHGQPAPHCDHGFYCHKVLWDRKWDKDVNHFLDDSWKGPGKKTNLEAEVQKFEEYSMPGKIRGSRYPVAISNELDLAGNGYLACRLEVTVQATGQLATEGTEIELTGATAEGEHWIFEGRGKTDKNGIADIAIRIKAVISEHSTSQPFGIADNVHWFHKNENQEQENPSFDTTRLEIYAISPGVAIAPFWNHGIPADFLRCFLLPYLPRFKSTKVHFDEYATRACFSGFGFRYNSWYGGAACFISSGTGGEFQLQKWLDGVSAKTLYNVNCYDQAAILQLALSLSQGDTSWQWLFAFPYGFIKPTQLVGYKEPECNSPFLSEVNGDTYKDLKVPKENYKKRQGFRNHAFFMSRKATGAPTAKSVHDGKDLHIFEVNPPPMIYDACAGPHCGSQTLQEYIESAIEPITEKIYEPFVNHTYDEPGVTKPAWKPFGPLSWENKKESTVFFPKQRLVICQGVTGISDVKVEVGKGVSCKEAGCHPIVKDASNGPVKFTQINIPKLMEDLDVEATDRHVYTGDACCEVSFPAIGSTKKQDDPMVSMSAIWKVDITVCKDRSEAEMTLHNHLKSHPEVASDVLQPPGEGEEFVGDTTLFARNVSGYFMVWLHGSVYTELTAVNYTQDVQSLGETGMDQAMKALARKIDDNYAKYHIENPEELEMSAAELDIHISTLTGDDRQLEVSRDENWTIGKTYHIAIRGDNIENPHWAMKNNRVERVFSKHTSSAEAPTNGVFDFAFYTKGLGEEELTFSFSHSNTLFPISRTIKLNIAENSVN